MSIIERVFFCFIIKKQEGLQVECFSERNSTDFVLKALAKLGAEYTSLDEQIKLQIKTEADCKSFEAWVGYVLN